MPKPGAHKSKVWPRPVDFFLLLLFMGTIHFWMTYKYRYAGKELHYWRATTDRNVTHYLDLHVANLPDNFCKNPTELLIVVHSDPANVDARLAIRETWGNRTLLAENNISLFFLLGENKEFTMREEVSNEIAIYNDIIVEDFVDCYSNLTIKSVAMLKLFQHQKNCKYLLKADEDVFVNIQQLILTLRVSATDRGCLMGRLISKEKRQNIFYKKWYSPRYMYVRHTYPLFLGGPAYLMSLDVAEVLYKTALKEPIFHLEDVYVTGICALKAGIKHKADTCFTDYGKPSRKCRIYDICTAHSFEPKEMKRLYNFFLDSRKVCNPKDNNKLLYRQIN